MSAIKVKPLVWASPSTPDKWGWRTHLARLDGRIHLTILELASGRCLYGPRSEPFPTLEAAQAAAQEEWSRFVLAAIESNEPRDNSLVTQP